MSANVDPKKAIVYCRVSTDEQTQELGMEAQERDCRRYCDAHGIEILEVFRESISGGADFDERKVLHEAIRALEQTKAGVFLVQKVDRFARSMGESQKIVARIRSLKAKIQFVQSGGTEGALAELQFNILMSVGQFELENIRDRINKAFGVKKERGEYLGGKIPFGKRGVKVERESGKRVGEEYIKFLEDDPAEQAILQKLRDFRSQGASWKVVAEKAYADGIRFRNGSPMDKEWIRRTLDGQKKAPYGMMLVDGVLEPVQYEQDILAWIAESHAMGASIDDMNKKLLEAKMLTREGKPPTPWWIRKRIDQIRDLKIFEQQDENNKSLRHHRQGNLELHIRGDFEDEGFDRGIRGAGARDR